MSRRVFRAMDQPVTFVQHPATRLYRQLDAGDTAFTLGAAKLQRLADTAIETEEAATTLTLAVYRRKDTEPVSGIESLRGKRLVLMNGYSYSRLGERLEEASDAIQTTEARTHKSALRMIQFGRADYLLNYMTPADTTIARNKLSGLRRDVLTRVDVHLYVSKAVPNARALAREWDQNLKALKRHNQLPHTNYYEMGE
ncbi:substrate-binding periplasmic protein [Halomonadaceae bacterium KBTZ08]